jgi:hypothetical protein
LDVIHPVLPRLMQLETWHLPNALPDSSAAASSSAATKPLLYADLPQVIHQYLQSEHSGCVDLCHLNEHSQLLDTVRNEQMQLSQSFLNSPGIRVKAIRCSLNLVKRTLSGTKR